MEIIEMKKKLIANLIIFIFCISCEQTQYQIELTGFTMGTTYNIKMVTKNVETSYKTNLNNQIDSILHSINKQMSTYLYDSEISTFNNSELIAPVELTILYKSLEQLSSLIKSSDWIIGNTMTIADISVAAQLSLLKFLTKFLTDSKNFLR